MSTTETKKKRVGELLLELAERNGGELTPEKVLETARDKNSGLHHLFEWDNEKASEQYRIWQASALIRRIRVTVAAQDEKVYRIRVFQNICPERENDIDVDNDKPGPPKGVYITMKDALTDHSDQVLAAAKRDARAFQQKYAALAAVAPIIESISLVFD